MTPTWEFDKEHNDKVSIEMVAFRVDVLTREKEDVENELREERKARLELEKRVAHIESYVQNGKGVMWTITIIGAAIGFLAAYGKSIFAPWTGKP